MRILQLTVFATFVSLAAFSQTPRMEFEVASIKPAEPINVTNTVSIGLHVDGAQVRLGYRSLQDLIRQAYRVRAYQVDGPSWTNSDRFDISAKLPAGAKPDQVPEMLQSLLADRFQLTFHRGSKEVQVLALVLTKTGLKMKPSDTAESDIPKGNLDVAASGGPGGVSLSMNGASYAFGNNRFTATNMTMDTLAEALSRYEPDPVVDMTGLTGRFDFSLELTPEDYQAMLIRAAIGAGVQLPPQALAFLDSSNGDSLGASLERLGLKLERRKAPVDVIIVDKAAKTPTEN